MYTKTNATKIAIELLPNIMEKHRNRALSFEELFALLIEKDKEVFLDEIGDPRYGILRGIVSRYKKGSLFLKNILIAKNRKGVLLFLYLENELLENEKTYKLYINTINYHNVIVKNQLSINEFMNLSEENKNIIKSIYEFNVIIEKYLDFNNFEEELNG